MQTKIDRPTDEGWTFADIARQNLDVSGRGCRTATIGLVSQLGHIEPGPKTSTLLPGSGYDDGDMELDLQVCSRARLSRDARFDGKFFIGVVTSRVYCRSICPA